MDSTLTWFETQSHTVRNPVFGFPATKTCMFRSIGDSKCHVIVFVAPTFFVLSMAFSMDMFRSSKAARTFSYSPRCWEKYSSQPRHPKKRKKRKIFCELKQSDRAVGVLLKLHWCDTSVTQPLGVWSQSLWLYLTCFLPYPGKMSNSIWVCAAADRDVKQDKAINGAKNDLYLHDLHDLPQSSSVSTLLWKEK